jgi:hypothetical protein
MANQEVKIQKTVYREDEFSKVVDNRFTTFTKATPAQDIDTVSELFRLYDKLFYSIPSEGATNSHEYLVKKSSEIYKLDQTTEDIQPLLDEISNLRSNLLEANRTIIELQTASVNNGSN